MNDNLQQQYRRSVRLRGYDYSQAGAYFITACAQDRVLLFGDVMDGEMRLNEYGEIVREEWFRSAVIRPEIELHMNEFVVMPNHVHGIVWIVDIVGATRRVAPTGRPRGPQPGTIGAIIGQFKSLTTKRINNVRNTPGISVWQRNYYEHIVRDEESFHRIRQYIADNPLQWAMDRENPNAVAACRGTLHVPLRRTNHGASDRICGRGHVATYRGTCNVPLPTGAGAEFL